MRWRTAAQAVLGRLRDAVRRHRALLWPVPLLLLLSVLSGPLFGAWMRWVELPGTMREQALHACADTTTAARLATAPGSDASTTHAPADASTAETVTTAIAARADLDRQQALYAPHACLGMRRVDAGPTVRTMLYRFDDGSLLTQHLHAAVPDRPALAPLFVADCPARNRQTLLLLFGVLAVGAVVILHRARVGRFFDFSNFVREPLKPGEVLTLLYAFTLIAGLAIGLQFGACRAAEHRDAVRAEASGASTPKSKDVLGQR